MSLFIFPLQEHSTKLLQGKIFLKSHYNRKGDNNDQLRIAAALGGSRKKNVPKVLKNMVNKVKGKIEYE